MSALPPTGPVDPLQRLVRSRARLRAALHDDAAQPQQQGASWLAGLASLPVARLLTEVLRGWWAQHPLRAAVGAVAETARVVVQPLAQSHPLALMLGALLAGATLAAMRPGRWLLRPALWAGLLPQIVRAVIARLPQPGSPPAPPG